jgi:hypothetical protein
MAGGSRAGAADQHGEDVVQALGELRGRQDTHPGRGQLDRQREPVQPPADVQHRGGVVVGEPERGQDQLGALLEQPDRVELGQRGRPWRRIVAGQ